MTTGSPCSELHERWELLLDGALAAAEERRLRVHLETCAACREFVHRDFRLSEGLRARVRPATVRQLPASATPWRRHALTAAAAAVLVALGFGLGRGFDAEPAPAGTPLAETGSLETSADPLVRHLPGGQELLLGAATRVELALHEGAAPVVTLAAGSLAVDGEQAPVTVATGAGSIEVAGRATVQELTSLGGPESFLVTVLSGRARHHEPGGEVLEALPGAPLVVTRGEPALLGATLERHRRFTEDEALVVMTSEEAVELSARQTSERNELERRVGELIEANQKLQLQLDAYAHRRGGKDVEPVSVDEMIRILAARADARAATGSPRNPAGSRTPERRRGFETLYFALRHLRDHEDEALPAIREHLLSAEASTARKLLGLRLLSRFRKVDVLDLVIPFARNEDRALRSTAIGCLTRQRDPSLRPLLENAFRDDPSQSIRISAAGGLLALGDHGEPLRQLLAWYRDPGTSRRLRRYVLTRILQAPVGAIADFLVEVAGNDEALEERDLRGVVELLGQLGTPEAAHVLEQLSARVDEPRLLLFIRSTLQSMPPR